MLIFLRDDSHHIFTPRKYYPRTDAARNERDQYHRRLSRCETSGSTTSLPAPAANEADKFAFTQHTTEKKFPELQTPSVNTQSIRRPERAASSKLFHRLTCLERYLFHRWWLRRVTQRSNNLLNHFLINPTTTIYQFAQRRCPRQGTEKTRTFHSFWRSHTFHNAR